MGVPRGVPDEYKVRNQIVASFESILFWWSTLNKNVDWINSLYYVKGITEQMGLTSLMAQQNRLALDMWLAEKGGV